MMVYQHHEHVDGTGYPVRVLKDEIHPWARMLAIVDVFDTMTAKRPDRRPATPENVLEYQRQQAGTHFDRRVCRMLDLSNDQSVMQLAWEKVELKPRLPDEMNDFFDQHGAMPRASRVPPRLPSLLPARQRQSCSGRKRTWASTRPMPRGKGCVSCRPSSCLPKERCRIRLPKTKDFQIEIVRCRRIADGCYECGAMFVLGNDSCRTDELRP